MWDFLRENWWIAVLAAWGLAYLYQANRKDQLETRLKGLPTPGFSYQLAKRCPNCRHPLYSTPIPDDWILERRPERAMRVCFTCDFQERAKVEPPWKRPTEPAWIRLDNDRERAYAYEQEISAERTKKARRMLTKLEGLLEGSSSDFEHAVAQIFSANGYQDVQVSGGAGDLNVDIKCVSPEGDETAIQCKKYRDKPVGAKEMQTFIGMMYRHHKISSAIFVTASRYTKPARELAEKHRILLVDGPELVRMAAALKPDGEEGSEDKRIAELTQAIESLVSWPQIVEEREEAARRAAAEAKRERIAKARRYGRRSSGYF